MGKISNLSIRTLINLIFTRIGLTFCPKSNIEIYPKYDWALARRGKVYLILQDYNKALADFNQAIELESNDDWYLYERALTYKVLNQPDKVRTDLTNAMQL
ncbi:MAG: tetratricopeptide repeat protein, partial [Calothrix sp. SM1_7_51]|nr:tetratricopeptide repeat protein [Calothrix sp. SM1_7_51]